VNGIVLDAGNSIIKAKRFSGGEITFPHAFAKLPEAQYKDICASYGDSIPDDFMRIDSSYYVVGESAERYGVLQHERGTSRYRRDYIGILAAAAMARSYMASSDLSVFASHPPGHVNYGDDLMDSLIGDWEIEIGGRVLGFCVEYVNIFDEPTGGLMNVLLNDEGTTYAKSDLKNRSVLVIDIGGGTTDWVVITAKGELDYGLAHTEPIGIADTIDRFTVGFKARYKELTKSSRNLPPDRVRSAIATGIYDGGGQTLDCQEEAAQARDTLINLVLRITRDRYAGGFAYDAVLFTGGGSGLLWRYLESAIENRNICLADDESQLHMANVRGGLKLWRLYKAQRIVP